LLKSLGRYEFFRFSLSLGKLCAYTGPVQSRLQQGELPAQQILEGVLLAVAGVLLFIPGFLTDALGMIVLLPAPRRALAKYLMTKMVVKSAAGFDGHFEQGSDNDGHTFEGEYQRKNDEDTNHLNKP